MCLCSSRSPSGETAEQHPAELTADDSTRSLGVHADCRQPATHTGSHAEPEGAGYCEFIYSTQRVGLCVLCEQAVGNGAGMSVWTF